ncbi:MAG: hypothetical protein JWM33_70 [Caulobacteraceae bacterium]|nr:hypothetical protein [Caulobacteraceae bacterium]
MTRLLRVLPWISAAIALLAAAMMGASALYGVAGLGLDLGARLLFLALLPLALQPWISRARATKARVAI